MLCLTDLTSILQKTDFSSGLTFLSFMQPILVSISISDRVSPYRSDWPSVLSPNHSMNLLLSPSLTPSLMILIGDAFVLNDSFSQWDTGQRDRKGRNRGGCSRGCDPGDMQREKCIS